MSGFFYRVHGLVLRSEFELPDLDVCDPAEFDIDICYGLIGAEWDWPGQQIDQWVHIDPTCQKVRLNVDNAADFLVIGGRRILVSSNDPATQHRRMAFLLGRVMAAALYQRGIFPLHASAVEMDAGAVLFVGARGAGKSTLVRHAELNGYPVLADDVSVLEKTDQAWVLHPGIRRVKLWQETLDHFGLSSDGLRHVEEQQGKFIAEPTDTPPPEKTELAAIVVLEDAVHDFALEPLPRTHGAKTLRAHSFEYDFIRALNLSQAFLDFAVTVAGDVPILSLQRPKGLEHLDDGLDYLNRAISA